MVKTGVKCLLLQHQVFAGELPDTPPTDRVGSLGRGPLMYLTHTSFPGSTSQQKLGGRQGEGREGGREEEK